MAPRTAAETPILIVGGGPVGLALAADLGLRGADCLLIEQGEGPPDHPRASAINARSMEFMRRFGVADAVKAAAAPEDFPHTALYCTSLNGFEIARIERPHHGGKGATPESPERPQRCNQLWLDPILRDLAASQAGVRLRYRCRFEELREERDCVIATAHDLASDQRIRIAAQYVVDCSGGHSPIRRAFGIGMSGSSYEGHNLSIFVRAPRLWEHHPMGKAALISFVEPAGLWRNLVILDGRELYRFGISGKAYFDAPEAASRFPTRCSRSGAGPRATWWPTAIARAGSSSPAMRPISTTRPQGSGSTRAWAMRSIWPGSSPRRWRAGPAAASSTPTRSSAIRSGCAMSAMPA
jgi:2-polyprenyl-6-methoxyphenol hydroxylase-like FAD-dependent oxidoreductase